MSDDPETTDHSPHPGTAPILEQVVAKLRGPREEVGRLRVETRATRTAVDDLGRGLRGELSGTRDVFRQELRLEARDVRAVLNDFERRLRTLEERQPAP